MNMLIIGTGLSGAIIAHEAAKKGNKILILEKRNHIAGNIYDRNIDGITTQIFGPHIFHTNNERVNSYMNQFWELNSYKNRVEGMVQDKLIPIPFNFKGIDVFFADNASEIKKLLIDKYGEGKRVGIMELLNQDNSLLKDVAQFVYKNIFENYTTKMWGISPKEIDPAVMGRVPVVIGYEDRYFSDKYEGLPVEGFTSAIEKMLDHENIEVRLNTNAVDVLELKDNEIYFEGNKLNIPVIFSGAIDELFEYKHGVLDYRSLNIEFAKLAQDKFQEMGVVNYPADPKMTRISEYKNMTLEKVDGITIISKEYPGKFELDSEEFGEPYYPMMTDESRSKYDKYFNEAKKFNNLHLVGRLATYKYLNMDQAIDLALNKAVELLGGE